MDDAQQIPLRKRKAADAADHDELDPRQPRLASWSSPTSPHPLSEELSFPKRVKLEPSLPSSRRYMRRQSPQGKVLPPSRPPINRLGNDVEDIGIVKSNNDPGPATGSLLREPVPLFSTIPIDPNSLHIPSSHPLVNRHTLKELHLDAIFRNPQLRHDILFDPAITFRPTQSKQKLFISDRYWSAVSRELESGCTCVSFDTNGSPHSLVSAPRRRHRQSEVHAVLTLRMPSRIQLLLEEFLEVFSVIALPPRLLHRHYPLPRLHDSYIHTLFDPELIHQELSRDLFEPSGVFTAIGDVLKAHCAPMRDCMVADMVRAAGDPRKSRKKRTVRAIRLCMEILELMKLDIANHQLHTLRPFLIRSSGQYELKAFHQISCSNSLDSDSSVDTSPRESPSSLRITREWLGRAHATMMKRQNIRMSNLPDTPRFSDLSRNQQMYVSVLSGLVNLVFYPPSNPSIVSFPSTVSLSASSPVPDDPCPVYYPSPSPTACYPETAYLDHSRLALLSTDAQDLEAVGMFLMLYRGLASSSFSSQPATESALVDLKNEIRDITIGSTGPSRIGDCLSCGCGTLTGNCSAGCLKQDIVLQVARRASPSNNSSTLASVDPELVNLASRWANTNIQPNSAVSSLLRARLVDAVFAEVVRIAWPWSGCGGSNASADPMALLWQGESTSSTVAPSRRTSSDCPPTGLEPVATEIRCLAEKIARLGVVHLNAYLTLYEQEGFLNFDDTLRTRTTTLQ
ncbi:T-complex protein 11-domain-containing protein [Mycena floridula]|nr:T-complex protein 11-domain-containing protein [Mycena floridula]